VIVLGVVVTFGFVTAVERKGKDCDEKKWVDEGREAVGVEFEHISGESIATWKRKRMCLTGKPLGFWAFGLLGCIWVVGTRIGSAPTGRHWARIPVDSIWPMSVQI
jgi:hypothetical protein